jgi:WD40 repeat protein
MTRLICGSTSESITLVGEPLADSGEGTVWRTNRNGYLAKIYHSSTSQRVQKLAVMISHPPLEPNSHLNHVSFAWPQSSLKNAKGDCVGFLMPEIKNAKELIDIYNPQRRKRLKLAVDWRFLHTTAQNIASIIAALHHSGYVLGDIKPQNILVNERALPAIIDTDSFQVRHPQNGEVYRCLVGSPGYTPPELIGKDFSQIEQTEIHDRFRLAVIIYQLLFGDSPVGGQWIGGGEAPEMNELIRQGLWLYAPNSKLQPVPRTIPLEIVHPQIKQYFLRCFNDGYHNPGLRPTAREWLKALKVANRDLVECARIDSHYYSQTYGKCYWCDRSTNLGVEIFPGNVRVQPPTNVTSPSQSQVININQSPNNGITGNLLQTLTGHFDSVNSVAFSPDGQTLASASSDKTIKLWSVTTGKLIQTLTGHFDSVNSVAFSPDGQTLASASSDKTIKLWSVTTGRLIQTLRCHSGSVNSVAFSPDGQTLASGNKDKIVQLWNVTTGTLLQTLIRHYGSVNSVAFSPDGQTLASASSDTTIKLYNITTGTLSHTLRDHSNLVMCVAFSPDGQVLASASADNTIKLWDVTTGRLLKTLRGHSEWVRCVAFSPDAQTLVSGSDDHTIKLWNVNTGKLLQTLSAHLDSIRSVAFGRDAQTLASGSDDNSIKVWKLLPSTTTSSSFQPTQYSVSPPASYTPPPFPTYPVSQLASSLSQSSWIATIWWLLLFLSFIGILSVTLGGTVGSFVLGVMGIGVCWLWYRSFWSNK